MNVQSNSQESLWGNGPAQAPNIKAGIEEISSPGRYKVHPGREFKKRYEIKYNSLEEIGNQFFQSLLNDSYKSWKSRVVSIKPSDGRANEVELSGNSRTECSKLFNLWANELKEVCTPDELKKLNEIKKEFLDTKSSDREWRGEKEKPGKFQKFMEKLQNWSTELSNQEDRIVPEIQIIQRRIDNLKVAAKEVEGNFFQKSKAKKLIEKIKKIRVDINSEKKIQEEIQVRKQLDRVNGQLREITQIETDLKKKYHIK